MSTIVKQPACAPQAKTVSVSVHLAAATEKGKASNHLVYVGESAARQPPIGWT